MSALVSDNALVTPPHAPRGDCLHLVLPGVVFPEPVLTARPRRWSEGWRRRIVGTDSAVWACASAIAATPSIAHRVCILGGNAADARAAALGLHAHLRLSPPFGRPELAAAGLQGILSHDGEPDIIMCWGGPFAALRDRLSSDTRRSVWMVADTETGVLEVKDTTAREPLTQALTPALPLDNIALADPATRAEQRARFNLPTDEFLIALIGDPAPACDALPLLYAASVLHVAAVRITPVLPRTAFNIGRIRRHMRAGAYQGNLIVREEPTDLIAPACDLAILIAHEPEGGPDRIGDAPPEPLPSHKLAVARTAARGTPVLVARSVWSEQLYPEAAHACLYPSPDHSAIAKTIFSLLDNDRALLTTACTALNEQHLRQPSQTMVDEVTAAWNAALARSSRNR